VKFFSRFCASSKFSISRKHDWLIGRKPTFPDAVMKPMILSDNIFQGTYKGYYSPKGKICPFRDPFALFSCPENPSKRSDSIWSRNPTIEGYLNKKNTILASNSGPKSCVGFDHEPALACHGRDRPRKGHWRPRKKGSKQANIQEYFR